MRAGTGIVLFGIVTIVGVAIFLGTVVLDPKRKG